MGHIKIGVIGAMHEEVVSLIGQLEDDHATLLSGMEFHEGSLRGVPVVVVQCGMGLVSAAMCAQTVINRFGATYVINTGVAGSLDASLDIGDLVISTDAVQHDMDTTDLGYAPGQNPGTGDVFYPADQKLIATVAQAAAQVAPDITAHRGRIASGDQFVASHEARERIIGLFGASCCEMEGSAIAQVCKRNQVPYVIVRAISDKADGSSVVDYPTFEEEAAHHCARIVTRAIELLA